MKALFIWNENSINYIKNVISKSKQFKKGNDVKYIISEKEFEKYLLQFNVTKGSNGNSAKNDLESYNKIYILAELLWDKNKLFEGYEIGFKLLEKWGTANSPHIEFFSLLDQKSIFENVIEKYRFIVKAFPFTNIFEIDSNYKFDTENLDTYKWNYFKYLILSNYGILDNFLHRLESIKESNTNFNKNLDDFIFEIKYYKDYIGELIFNNLANIKYNDHYVSNIKTLLENRLIEIVGEKKSKLEIPETLRILVVDDNQEDILLIENSLKRYKNKIITTKSGEEALQFIENDECDIIITDLELLNTDGFYQKVQGVELVNAVNNSLEKVIGIITGLGRKGISKLLNIDQKLIIPKKYLHRFEIDEEIDNLLKNLLEAYKIKENVLQIDFGPQKGIFNKPGFRNSLAKAFSIETFEKETWDFAHEILNKFKNKTLSSSDWDKEIIKTDNIATINYHEFIEKKLKTLLAHRLIVMYLSTLNEGKIFADNNEEFIEILNNNTIYINKNYINTICLHYETIENEKIWKIKNEKLFPQEINFLKDIYSEYQNILIINNAPKTYVWLKRYFDFEDEWYSTFNVSNNINDWNYEDLNNVVKYLYYDLNKEKGNSIYKETLDSINTYLTRTVEREIYPALPEIEKRFEEIGKILEKIDKNNS